jgi:predicted tellurium resistance membrane protein TerC
MEWIADPTAWLGLGTLVLLEIVLGIDNLIFIAILVDRLPPAQRNRARVIGLGVALLMRVGMLTGISWLQSLTAPLFTVLGAEITVRGLILIAGGLYLLVKATTELHARLEGTEAPKASGAASAALWQAIVQIVIVDAVFSIDSIVTAVGMVDHLAIMIIAVVIAIAAMMLVSGPLTNFVSAHPSVVILCLSFLLTIGFSLFVEGFGLKIPKGYLYAAIAFSVMIEAFNQIARRNQVKRAVVPQDLRSRAAEAILRILGGTRSGAPSGEDLSSILAARNAGDLFAPAERKMVQGILGMAERPVRSIMTPAADVVWLNVGDGAEALSRKIFQTGHAAYPVCRDNFDDLLGVARVPDLVYDLLEKGRIDPATLEREPLTVREDGSVLQMVEQVRGARVPMAIVNDRSGSITGVVTATDLLQAILGERHQPA